MKHELLKCLRRKKNISQEQLAEILNVSTVHISHIETGKAIPTLQELCKISKYFQVSVSTLIDDKSQDYDDLIMLLNNSSPAVLKILLKTIKAEKEALDIFLT